MTECLQRTSPAFKSHPNHGGCLQDEELDHIAGSNPTSGAGRPLRSASSTSSIHEEGHLSQAVLGQQPAHDSMACRAQAAAAGGQQPLDAQVQGGEQACGEGLQAEQSSYCSTEYNSDEDSEGPMSPRAGGRQQARAWPQQEVLPQLKTTQGLPVAGELQCRMHRVHGVEGCL